MRSVLCTLRLLLPGKSFILVLQKVLQTVRVSFPPKRAYRAEKNVTQYLDRGIDVGGEVGACATRWSSVPGDTMARRNTIPIVASKERRRWR